jgi:hypothetical protein
MKSSIALVAVMSVCTCASAAARPAKRHGPAGMPVPAGFVGMNAGGPLLDPTVNLAQQFDRMVASGIESVRVVFDWSTAQPYPNDQEVPAGQQSRFVDIAGVPTDFSATDQIVALAAQRGLSVLPIVVYAPPWDSGHNPSGGFPPPARTAPYANYLTALIDRYGPHGNFWTAHHPRLAIRAWQIWNEPNITAYWPRPFAPGYVPLLRAAHDAIKRADGGASVVLGALTNLAWQAVGQIVKIRGSSRLFDVVSVNGFTSTPTRVVLFLHLMRRAMNRIGLRTKPLIDTELSWPTSLGVTPRRFDWDTTPAGQARDIAAVLPDLAAARKSLGLSGFYYYTWMDAEAPGDTYDFDFAGLTRVYPGGRVVPKPGLAAFMREALKIEGCRAKGPTATRCLR